MRGIRKTIAVTMGLLCAAGVFSCKSSQKKTVSAVDYQIDESYNPDDYGRNEYDGYGGYDGGGTGGGYYGGAKNADFVESAKGVVWELIEVRIGYGLVALDRALMASDGMSDMYTLQFTNEGLSGKAAPNRYFAPYKKREGMYVSISPIVGTLMSGNASVGGLTESNYYWYLQRIEHGQLANGIIDLYTEDLKRNAGDKHPDIVILRFRAGYRLE